MKLEIVKAGSLQTNCYVVIKDNECIIFDCGGDEVTKYLEKEKLTPLAVFLTHGHYDHIAGLKTFKEKYKDVNVYVNENEKELITDANKNCGARFFNDNYIFNDAVYIKDNDVFNILSMEIKAIYTPGHTIGGCSYYIEKEKVLFSGDTLFYHSSGRTDLPTGDIRKIIESIGAKLMKLPDDTKVYPGHEIETTIGEERKANRILELYREK